MLRLLAVLTTLSALGASAASIAFTRDTAIVANTQNRQVAACADGRVYVIRADATPASVRLVSGGSSAFVTTAGTNDAISCVNNVLYLHRVSPGPGLLRNDGSALGAPTLPVADTLQLPPNSRVVGGLVLALFIPVPTFVALDSSKRIFLTTTPSVATSWRQVGDAWAADMVVLGGGFLEHRLYAANFDDSLWENVGQGCNAYWRRLSLGAPPTVRSMASDGLGRVVVLDDAGAVHRGVVLHERQDIVLDNDDFNVIEAALRTTSVRVNGTSADFTAGPILGPLGIADATIALPRGDVSFDPFGSTTYSPNDINDSPSLWSITGSGRNITISAGFEEAGLEIVSSNTFFPNINISTPRGTVTFGGKVGMCGQPEVTATAATFSGNFHGVDNFFSFVIDFVNGDLRNAVQTAMLTGLQSALAQPNSQLALQSLFLNRAQAHTGGAAWSHIVGNTFSITSGTIRFSVER